LKIWIDKQGKEQTHRDEVLELEHIQVLLVAVAVRLEDRPEDVKYRQ